MSIKNIGTKFQEVKNLVNLSDVATRLGSSLTKQSGSNTYHGTCPTGHASSSGISFHIDMNKGLCHCFNCDIGGDAISLVEEVNGLSKWESLKWLVKEFDLKVDLGQPQHSPKPTPEEIKERNEMIARSMVFEKVYEIGKKLLYQEEGSEALKYLTEERGCDVEVLKKTEWFYLPENFNIKTQLIKENPEMKGAVGLLRLNGFYGDNFRLAFPYHNKDGAITGFLKRAIAPKGMTVTTYDGKEHNNVRWDSTPKLKKDDLFGLDKVDGKENTLIIVEGYPDAIYLQALGIKNIVAVGQGLLSEKHLAGMNSRKIKNAIISFDNDGVGEDNSLKAVKMLLKDTDITPYVIDPKVYGDDKDPDEYLRGNGIEKLKKVFETKPQHGVVWAVKVLLSGFEGFGEIRKSESKEKALELLTMVDDESIYEKVRENHPSVFVETKAVLSKLVKSRITKKENKEIVGPFWLIRGKKVEIKTAKFIEFLVSKGFAKIYYGKEYTYVRIVEMVAEEIIIEKIKDYVLEFIDAIDAIDAIDDESKEHKDEIKESILDQVTKFFNNTLLSSVKSESPNLKSGDRNTGHLYYKNGFVTAKRGEELQLNSYATLTNPVWKSRILEREFEIIPIKRSQSEYEQFIWNVVRKDEDRFMAMCSSIGFLLHGHKEKSLAKAIIAVDEKISDNPNGRSGKSLFGLAISKMKKSLRIDGKNFEFHPRFTFQEVRISDEIIEFNDVRKNFDFERLFSVITDDMSVENKTKDPYKLSFEESPKLLINTNYTIAGSGGSFSARMYEMEFSDHYNEYHSPRNEFGHDFFDDWNDEEWNRFDNFMLECLMLYLDEGLISYKKINLDRRKLVAETSNEFLDFMGSDFVFGVEYFKSDVFQSFKKSIGYENDYANDCPVKKITFTKWLRAYAKFENKECIERRSNGSDLIKINK